MSFNFLCVCVWRVRLPKSQGKPRLCEGKMLQRESFAVSLVCRVIRALFRIPPSPNEADPHLSGGISIFDPCHTGIKIRILKKLSFFFGKNVSAHFSRGKCLPSPEFLPPPLWVGVMKAVPVYSKGEGGYGEPDDTSRSRIIVSFYFPL